jgi:hypothetical protein
MPNKLQYHKRRLIARGLAKAEDFGEKEERVEKKSEEQKSEVKAEDKEEKSEE